MDQQQKKKIDPTEKTLQLRSRANARNMVFIAKIHLRKFDEVELQGLGDAISVAVRVAETLQRQGLATIERVQTFTQQIDQARKAKIIVALKVTPEGKKRIHEEIKE
ncbi:hypothetical protein pb186bvf_012077 [Paramecium bursaria]